MIIFDSSLGFFKTIIQLWYKYWAKTEATNQEALVPETTLFPIHSQTNLKQPTITEFDRYFKSINQSHVNFYIPVPFMGKLIVWMNTKQTFWCILFLILWMMPILLLCTVMYYMSSYTLYIAHMNWSYYHNTQCYLSCTHIFLNKSLKLNIRISEIRFMIQKNNTTISVETISSYQDPAN